MNNEKLINDLKKSIDILIMIELCKLGATRDQSRTLLGKLDNNLFSKINMVVASKEK